MMNTRNTLSMMSLLIVLVTPCRDMQAQEADVVQADEQFSHAIESSPLSPFIRIYAVQYSYQLTPNDGLIAGVAYMNINYDFGSTHAPALITGYRRTLWKDLHIEYQLWPVYDSFYEKNEAKYYNSFDVWNEFRIGYQFNFNVSSRPCYVSLQWPFGFGLYASNKPRSFTDHEKGDRFFYFPPLLFVGIRF